MPQSPDSHRFSVSWLRWWHHPRRPKNSTLPTPLNSFITASGSVSDCHTKVGFRCSKKVEKHWSSQWMCRVVSPSSESICKITVPMAQVQTFWSRDHAWTRLNIFNHTVFTLMTSVNYRTLKISVTIVFSSLSLFSRSIFLVFSFKSNCR